MDLDKRINIIEALRVAKANKKEIFNKEVADDLDVATRFALALGIKSGKIKNTATVVYQAYSSWAETPIPKKEFLALFTDLFPCETKGTTTYYLLNYQPPELLKEASK